MKAFVYSRIDSNDSQQCRPGSPLDYVSGLRLSNLWAEDFVVSINYRRLARHDRESLSLWKLFEQSRKEWYEES